MSHRRNHCRDWAIRSPETALPTRPGTNRRSNHCRTRLDDDQEAPPGDPLPGLGQSDAEQSDPPDAAPPEPGDPDESDDASTDDLPAVAQATVPEEEPDALPVVAPGSGLEARQGSLQTLPAAPPGLSAYLGRLESTVDEQGRGRIRWGWGALVVVLVAAILAGTGYFIEQSRNSANVAFSPPLQFGIYPGGPVGTVNITDSPVAENPAQRLAALKDLRATNSGGGPRPFVVRLYESFTGQPSVDSWTGTGANASTDSQITEYSENGFDIDLVVRYEPVTYAGISTVQSYLTFIRQLVQRYGPNPNFRYLQIGNEVNQTQAPTSSDGAYGGAVQALAFGVEAASQEAGRDSYPIQVGLQLGLCHRFRDRPGHVDVHQVPGPGLPEVGELGRPRRLPGQLLRSQHTAQPDRADPRPGHSRPP